MRLFFDSSAFAKRFIEETGSDEVESLCNDASVISVSSICFPEIISALNRRLREKVIKRKDYLTIKNRMIEEFEELEIINVIPEVVSKSITLLEKNNLRTLDAIHIASAILWLPDLFITSDKRQSIAAKKSGLKVRFIE
ncbi:MAG: type II toxin-antitoxin system VapC family toxin [Ignavibacterium sp.]|uniref:type II toxin-antitoxin system VapC family toxin n=1 Tax=Ignavibacterium sp. TaxID=2651167 RepID=UPI003296BF5B